MLPRHQITLKYDICHKVKRFHLILNSLHAKQYCYVGLSGKEIKDHSDRGHH